MYIKCCEGTNSSLFVALVIVASLCLNCSESKESRHDDICGVFNGRRLYLEASESGILTGKNVQEYEDYAVDKVVNRVGVRDEDDDNVTTYRRCSLELITCPSCAIVFRITYLNVSQSCNKTHSKENCTCDHLWIYEPQFEELSGEQFCGYHSRNSSGNGSTFYTYVSQTRTTTVSFLFSATYEHAFTIEYSSERNRRFLYGIASDWSVDNSSQFIESPFFPMPYSRDLSVEYIINCQSTENCIVRLIFSDFQLSGSSIFEFFDWNGQRLDITTGASFRPPILLSTGPTLVVRFYANGGSDLGFKAFYSFISDDVDNSTYLADTNCGGFVNNLGGAITMMNMITDGSRMYDCYWIIQPPKSFMHLKTHQSLKVATFQDFVGFTELTIKQGLTSNGTTLDTLRYPHVSHFFETSKQEHVVPIDAGYYVSLKGTFGPQSRFALIYSSFNYKDCYSGSDFICKNHRCIVIYLTCDGFNHCGDNSDEPDTCLQGTDGSETGRRWYSNIPNYYFPKIDRFGDVKITTIIFSICSLVLISVILTLIFLICRINSRTRTERHFHDHIQTIAELIEAEHEEGMSNEPIVDDPPNYEAPPDYDQVAKCVVPRPSKRVRMVSSKKRRTISKRRCSCSNSATKLCSVNNTPSSTPPNVENQDMQNTSSVVNLFESDAENISILIQPFSNRSCQTTSIPHSPPPAYSRISTCSSISEAFRRDDDDDTENVREGCLETPEKVLTSNLSNNSLGNGLPSYGENAALSVWNPSEEFQ